MKIKTSKREEHVLLEEGTVAIAARLLDEMLDPAVDAPSAWALLRWWRKKITMLAQCSLNIWATFLIGSRRVAMASRCHLRKKEVASFESAQAQNERNSSLTAQVRAVLVARARPEVAVHLENLQSISRPLIIDILQVP